jgi:hypothetical protein
VILDAKGRDSAQFLSGWNGGVKRASPKLAEAMAQ